MKNGFLPSIDITYLVATGSQLRVWPRGEPRLLLLLGLLLLLLEGGGDGGEGGEGGGGCRGLLPRGRLKIKKPSS